MISILYMTKRTTQYNFEDIGVIQKKLIGLLILLFFFNDPLYYFLGLSPNVFICAIRTLMQASFVAILLHFWVYLMDTISQEDMIRENPMRFS